MVLVCLVRLIEVVLFVVIVTRCFVLLLIVIFRVLGMLCRLSRTTCMVRMLSGWVCGRVICY